VGNREGKHMGEKKNPNYIINAFLKLEAEVG